MFSKISRPSLSPTRLIIHLVPAAFSAGIKRLRRETDHSLPFIVEVKNDWRHTTPINLRCVPRDKFFLL